MQKTEKSSCVSLYAAVVLMTYILINQGGYFAGGIILAGLIVSILLLKTKIQILKADVAFFVFALWYLFCSLRTGFDVMCVSKGLMPMLCLMFKFLLGNDREKSEEIFDKVIKVSFYITVAAVIIGIVSCVKERSLVRLMFPFQYANVSAIFFGVMFILSRYSDNEWAKKRQYVFLAALALTQSVGAIAITVLTEIIMCKNLKRSLIIIGVIAAGAFVVRNRVYHSIGTFVERFLQMHDGLLCLKDNPFFGIGAQRWGLLNGLYQTGFYNSTEIHGSIVQLGVESGIPGLVFFVIFLFFAFGYTTFSNKVYIAGIIMIFAHSCIDFTLSFTSVGFLLMLLLSCGESKNAPLFEFKTAVKPAALILIFSCFAVLAVGVYQVKHLEALEKQWNYPEYISYYETNPLARASYKSKESYARALKAMDRKEDCLETLKTFDILSTDMVLLERECLDDWGSVLNHLKERPYIEVLYRKVYYNCENEEMEKETEELLEKAKASMSFLGKILFDFKGDRIM